MSVSRRHTLYGVAAGATLIGGIDQQGVNSGTVSAQEPMSGEIYPRFQSIVSQEPSAHFRTAQIATAMGAVGFLGANIGSLAGKLVLYAQAHAAGSTRASGASHRKYTINAGLLYPQGISITDSAGHAALTYIAAATYDGANEPVIPTDSVSLPAGLTDAERFAIGPVTIGGVTISHIRSLEIDFGLTVEVQRADSDIWPTFVSIVRVAPMIRLTGIDVELFKSTNIPLTGKAATHANTAIYLRKRAAGSTYVANGTAQHLKFTAAGLAYVTDLIDATDESPAMCNLEMPLVYDGSNYPILVTIGSAIS